MTSKVVVITGAASGIGLALAQAYVNQGDTVFAADIDEGRLQSLAMKLGDNFMPTVLDITDANAWQCVVDEIIESHSKIDLLFNNAGIMSSGEFSELSLSSWQTMININLMGAINGCHVVYAVMKKQGFGTIVNTASTAGVTPVLYSTSYATTKHGLVGFSNSLREEAREYGIKIVVLIPGLVETNLFESALDEGEKNSRAMADSTPIKKISPQKAAEFIINDLKKNKEMIVFPLVNKVVVLLYRLFPRLTTKLIVKNQRY